MNDNRLSFYVLPVNPASQWKHLVEAATAEELQQAIAKRHFGEPAFLTVFGDQQNWLTVGIRAHQHFIATQISSSMIRRDQAESLIASAKLQIRIFVETQTRLIAIKNRVFPNTSDAPSARLYKFPS